MEKFNNPEIPSNSEMQDSSAAEKENNLRKRYNILISTLFGYHRFGSLYTGIENELGHSTVVNTPMAGDQLLFALATSNHPAIDELLEKMEKKEVTRKNFDPEPLREATVLQGMKILDLGCGLIPTFARSARRLGADVYTVDVVPAAEFELWKPSKEDLAEATGRYEKLLRQLSEEYEVTRKLEQEKHIQLNLKDRLALEEISQRTGGNFDLVTDAHITSGFIYNDKMILPPANLKNMALGLLKDKGVYYQAPRGINVKI